MTRIVQVRLRPLPLAASLLAVLVTVQGCDPSSTGPADDLRLELLRGGAQRALSGDTLPQPVIVEVRDGDGEGRPGVAIEAEVVEGGGLAWLRAATTNEVGQVEIGWAVGARGEQRLRVRTVEGGGEPLEVTARAVGPDETDVVVVRGADGPLRGLAVLAEPGSPRPIHPVEERIGPDTVIPIRPRDGGEHLVLVVATANALALHPVRWTPGADTVVVELNPPVALGLQVNVWVEPFPETKEEVERQIAAAQEIFRTTHAGVLIDDIEFVDRTEPGRERHLQGTGLCSSLFVGDRIHVDYVHSVAGTGGIGCAPSQVWIDYDESRSGSRGNPGRLLAHELGHVMSLPHGPGLMSYRGHLGLTTGQIFAVHFSSRSAVNAIARAHPPESLRRCGAWGIQCLPYEYELGQPLDRFRR